MPRYQHKHKRRGEKSYLISLVPPRPPDGIHRPHYHRKELPATASPRDLTNSHCPAASASCLSSPLPRRSARLPSAAASPLFPSSPQAVAPPCTWPSRAGVGSRPARSGASRSAAARSAAVVSRHRTWTRTRHRRRQGQRSGKGSRWGSRCRRSPCRCCRTRRSPTSGRDLSGSPSASSCSTCGRSASSSASLLVVSLWLPTMMAQQISGTLLHTRNHKHRSSLRNQNHQVPTCLKVIQLR